MKQLFLIIAFVLAFGSSFAQTWDILDKSMTDNYEGWSTAKGGTIVITQNEGYVNLAKSGNWAWFRPATPIGALTSGVPYSIEFKVRVNSGDQGQISFRMNGGEDQITAPVFLKYGDGVTGGSVSTVAGGASNAYTLNTSDWQIYRLVLRSNHREYDVYLDGVNEPVLETGKTASKTDQGGVYFGAETGQSCNIDIEYVKIGTGDFFSGSNANLSSLGVDAGKLTPEFNPGTTEYFCELFTSGPNTVTPSATAASESAVITGLEPVALGAGRGVSTITVTAGDGETTKTYTVHYLQVGEDMSSLIVNNDFDYAAENVMWNDGSNADYPKFPDGSSTFVSNCFRPVKTNVTTVETHAGFYGWQMSDWSFLFTKADGTTPSQSIGIGSANETFHGTSATWIAGNSTMKFPDDFEFYQTIDKDNIAGGTYKVTCRLGIASGHLTSQRLFANRNVQFFGEEADYEMNKTAGELYSYAGYAALGENIGKELKVYVTLSESDSLKLGLRGGSYKGDGNLASTNNLPGWFKFDYFTLTKIDPALAADATLSDMTLSVGSIGFSPETLSYNVILSKGTTAVTPVAVSNVPDVAIAGTEEVDLTSGSGTSTIVVTALDGSTQKTYTVNYTVSTVSGVDETNRATAYCFTDGRKMKVQGAEAYVVYSVNGVKIADVKVNASDTSVDLLPGVYVVKTRSGEVFKVLIK